jgi:hypothetical protein
MMKPSLLNKVKRGSSTTQIMQIYDTHRSLSSSKNNIVEESTFKRNANNLAGGVSNSRNFLNKNIFKN